MPVVHPSMMRVRGTDEILEEISEYSLGPASKDRGLFSALELYDRDRDI